MACDISVTELFDLDIFVELCQGALASGVNAKDMVDLLRKAKLKLKRPDPYPTKALYLTTIKHAEDIEAFSKIEAEHGYPYLYSLASIKIWSILESGVDDLAIECIKSLDKCADIELIRGLKGPLLEFLDASEDDKNEFLIAELKIAVKAQFKPGIAKFEALLKPLGLGGEVADIVSKVFIELVQTRNLIVHKKGIVDKKFITACPWVNIKLGDKIFLTRNIYLKYLNAAFWYFFELDNRYIIRQSLAEDDNAVLLDKFLSLTTLYDTDLNTSSTPSHGLS